jgi:hypothetical protein
MEDLRAIIQVREITGYFVEGTLSKSILNLVEAINLDLKEVEEEITLKFGKAWKKRILPKVRKTPGSSLVLKVPDDLMPEDFPPFEVRIYQRKEGLFEICIADLKGTNYVTFTVGDWKIKEIQASQVWVSNVLNYLAVKPVELSRL